MRPRQPELFDQRRSAIPEIAAGDPNVELFVRLLDGADWTHAKIILERMGKEPTEDNKRWLRALRRASGGRIVGGPGMPGYKLVNAMTAEEYKHWRNAMRSQTRDMLRAVLQADKVFYGRAKVEVQV